MLWRTCTFRRCHQMSANNRMQRGGTDKVLRRGRVSSVVAQVTSTRVREALCPRADAGRWAT
jgi:hypothetical protein